MTRRTDPPRPEPQRLTRVLAAIATTLACVLGAPSVRASSSEAVDPPSTQVAYPILPAGFHDEAVVTDLNEPVSLAFLPDGRLLFAELKTARVRMVVNGRLASTDPLLAVDSVATATEEWGLVGIAVDPGWPARPFLYAHYDALGGTIRVSRYEAQGDLDAPGSGNLSFDPASRTDILRDVPDLRDSHNGGCLKFGPDGMLYVSLGEDQFACGAQDTVGLMGSILRLDVAKLPAGGGQSYGLGSIIPADNPYAWHPNPRAQAVWAMGLRNPFRFDIDPVTHSLFIADVGWHTWEEIDIADGPGLNFGWPYFEGPAPYVGACPGITPTTDVVEPVFAVYRRGVTASVIGGVVYRSPGCGGCGFPAGYEGDYFFSEYYGGTLRRLKYSDGAWTVAPAVPGQPNADDWGLGFEQVVDYTIGPDGAVWYARLMDGFEPGTGEIHRMYHLQPGLDAPAAAAARIAFDPPYPVPARSGAHLSFTLSAASGVRLDLLDVQGRRVRTLLDGAPLGPGRHAVRWDGRADDGSTVPAGVYLARLSAAGGTLHRRIPLVR